MKRASLVGLVLVLAMIAAACGGEDDATDTTAATAATETTEATATTVAVLDITTAVDDYLSAIPEGWQAVGDIVAFKDGLEASGGLLIDVREPGEYEEGHIPGAVNIPIRTLAQNLDKIPMDRQVYVYCKSGFRAAQSLSALGILGYDNLLSYKPGWGGWTEAGEEVSTEAAEAEVVGAPDIDPELVAAVDGYLSSIPEGFLSAGAPEAAVEAIDAGAWMLDVRTADEYAEGHVAGATNINLRELAQNIDTVDSSANVIAYCGSGHRAGMSVPALHILAKANSKGYGGSFQSLVDAGAPTE